MVNVQQATLATGQRSGTYFRLQSLRLLLRFECDEPVALAHAGPVHDDLGALHRPVGAEDAGQICLGGVATKRGRDIGLVME